MLRIICSLAICLLAAGLLAEEPTPGEKLIQKAIADLEAGRGKLGDLLEQSKIDKAIRELEVVIGEEEKDPKPEKLTFEVTPAMLRKKFAGKAVFNSKTGELTLAYDFASKNSLSDFEVSDQNVAVSRKMLGIDAADKLTHKAKWKSFTVATVIHFKGMRGVGINTTNGTHLASGGANPDTMYLGVPGTSGASKIVPDKFRSGTVPIGLSVTGVKTSAHWGEDRLALPTALKEDVHQITLVAGTEGCAFSNLVIFGVPDPAWFKEFLAK
jgi:hypothetical protein